MFKNIVSNDSDSNKSRYRLLLMKYHHEMVRTGQLIRLIKELESLPLDERWERFRLGQLKEYREELSDLKSRQ